MITLELKIARPTTPGLITLEIGANQIVVNLDTVAATGSIGSFTYQQTSQHSFTGIESSMGIGILIFPISYEQSMDGLMSQAQLGNLNLMVNGVLEVPVSGVTAGSSIASFTFLLDFTQAPTGTYLTGTAGTIGFSLTVLPNAVAATLTANTLPVLIEQVADLSGVASLTIVEPPLWVRVDCSSTMITLLVTGTAGAVDVVLLTPIDLGLVATIGTMGDLFLQWSGQVFLVGNLSSSGLGYAYAYAGQLVAILGASTTLECSSLLSGDWLSQQVDEVIPDDADVIFTTASTDACRLKLLPIAPQTGQDLMVRYRGRGSFRVTLYCGTVVIAQWDESANDWTTFQHSLSAYQQAKMTNPDDLWIVLES